VEAARTFTGWGFSQFGTARFLGSPNPWDYNAMARDRMSAAETVLDIGTGGGERFSRLCADFTGKAVATESWHINAPIAAKRLQPLGASLIYCDDDNLPFRDASFDLLLNRHAGMNPKDAARLLKPGGMLLTEQITGDHWGELRQFFPRSTTGRSDGFFRWLVAFRSTGLVVMDARKYAVPAAYRSLGDLVFMLCVTPWTIPDFDPLGADLATLLAIEETLTADDGLVLTQGHSLIVARKPL
jgi:SAM-dependent methyltransferase